jgi:hypothetical protein
MRYDIVLFGKAWMHTRLEFDASSCSRIPSTAHADDNTDNAAYSSGCNENEMMLVVCGGFLVISKRPLLESFTAASTGKHALRRRRRLTWMADSIFNDP